VQTAGILLHYITKCLHRQGRYTSLSATRVMIIMAQEATPLRGDV